MPRTRGKSRQLFSLGRVILILMVATGVGLTSLVYLYGSSPTPPGFPFQCAGTEGTALHIHPHLAITINGHAVVLPSEIGIVNSGKCFQPLHTHDTEGIIHVESPRTDIQYTLGQFFQTWNATYHSVSVGDENRPIVCNATDILGFRADASHSVVMLVDGQPSSSFGSLVLNSLDGVNIEILYTNPL